MTDRLRPSYIAESFFYYFILYTFFEIKCILNVGITPITITYAMMSYT